jgi:hypothetical protein
MVRFITKDVFIGLMREAVLGYIQQGKQCPQTWEEVETLMLTVINEKEVKIYNERPWTDEATQEVICWLLSEDPMRSWFRGCELGREIIEAEEKAVGRIAS